MFYNFFKMLHQIYVFHQRLDEIVNFKCPKYGLNNFISISIPTKQNKTTYSDCIYSSKVYTN